MIRWDVRSDHVEEHIDVIVRRALARARRTLAPSSSVESTRADRAVLLVHPARLDGGVREFARHVAALVDQGSDGELPGVVAGFGDEVGRIAAAGASHDQAVRALDVAARLPELPHPVGWCDLGVNRMLSRLTTRDDVLAEIPAGCRELAIHPELLQTVERFLELGCDVKATAEELSLHRTSVYARLEKAERIAGIAFKSGEDRLALHLGLRLLRLTGDHDPTADAEG